MTRSAAIWCAAAVIGVALGAGFGPRANAQTVVTLDGKATNARVAAIDSAGVVRTADGEQFDLQQLRYIDRNVKATDPADGAARVWLIDGSELLADRVKIERSQITVAWTGDDATVLPVGSVAGVTFDGGITRDALPELFLAGLTDADARTDALYVPKGETLNIVRGVLETLGHDSVTFVWNDKSRSVERSKLFGMTLARTGAAVDLRGQVAAELTDGSTLWGRVRSLADGKLTLQRDDKTRVTLPWAKVRRLTVRSARMVFLSDLEPLRVASDDIFTNNSTPLTRDHSTLPFVNHERQPLRLGGKVYEKGVGIHSIARVTYQVDGQYDVFAAIVGLDDGASAQGDCVAQVVADGRVVFEKRVKHGDKPTSVRVDLGGAERIDLVVKAGENSDQGDHVTWADARLIKSE